MALLRAVLSIESADESDVCVFGMEICWWAPSYFINDQGASVSCGLRGPLCYGVDGGSKSPDFSKWACHSGSARACEEILFSLSQYAHYFVRGIKMQNSVKGKQFGPVLFSLVVMHSDKLDWASTAVLSWYHHVFCTGVVWGVPDYRRHKQELPKLKPVCLAKVSTLAMEKSAEELKRAR